MSARLNGAKTRFSLLLSLVSRYRPRIYKTEGMDLPYSYVLREIKIGQTLDRLSLSKAIAMHCACSRRRRLPDECIHIIHPLL
jgi:hypothetical protein